VLPFLKRKALQYAFVSMPESAPTAGKQEGYVAAWLQSRGAHRTLARAASWYCFPVLPNMNVAAFDGKNAAILLRLKASKSPKPTGDGPSSFTCTWTDILRCLILFLSQLYTKN
jgi:hypothetical protein